MVAVGFNPRRHEKLRPRRGATVECQSFWAEAFQASLRDAFPSNRQPWV
jgi:hypothetical protein